MWKCHKETFCIAILNKNAFFEKMENRKVKEVLSGSQYQWEGGGYKEMIKILRCLIQKCLRKIIALFSPYP
jgi:hypothetical protein